MNRISELGTSVALLLLLTVPDLAWAPTRPAVAAATGSWTNLGPPTGATTLSPIGSFHRVRGTLRSHGKPEFLFIGTSVDSDSAAERWPVVKALDQFGTLSHVAPAVTHPCDFQRYGQLDCTPPQPPAGSKYQDGLSTFDWDQAHYASRYLTFVHEDLIDWHLHVRQLPTSVERSLFNRYVRVSGYPKWQDAVWHTALDPPSAYQPTHQFPLVAVGDYLDTGANVAIYGDLSTTTAGHTLLLPFATVQRSLQRGRAIDGAPSSLIVDYNGEANIITALICHADGMRPAKVCARSGIEKILRHVK